ncbi:MAG: SDR family oxidoreductase [Sedimenticola sp.]|nr:SDR family oxidoreductase [Sedimenticola sp.]
MHNKVILGCGYLGQRLARQYQAQGETVTGVVRSPNSAGVLQAAGIPALQMDLDQPLDTLPPLAGCELFYFIPPPRGGTVEQRVERFLAALGNDQLPRRILYLSTTGVYGDCAGEWVDETRPVAPVAERAQRRWDGERRFRSWCREHGCELVILRVAGIYGPGKLPLARLRRGEPMVPEVEAPYTNRIHVDDLAQVCVAAMQHGGDGEIYNVSDGTPGNMTDYFNRVADWAGLPRPPLVPLAESADALSAGMRSYLQESRRLDSSKMRRELGVVLRYPDLASGLRGCAEAS